jgi:hypothetical protein
LTRAGDDQQGSAIRKGQEERRKLTTAGDDQQGSAIRKGQEERRK